MPRGKPFNFPYTSPRLPIRQFSLGSGAQALRGWSPVLNILCGAYIGGLIVCFGSLYVLYEDADDRQPIPFELSFKNQITAVKAINKDDALKSPRYAVKHYRRLLIELAKEAGIEFDEADPENKYRAPILDSNTLIHKRSTKFANFYIDIVSRYAKALLAKGQLDISVETLEKLVYDQEIFYRLGDAERLSQCARLLARISPSLEQTEALLTRSIDMIEKTFSSVLINPQYLLQDNSTVTDELITCLNELAFAYAKESINAKKTLKQLYLSKALNIYLANLKTMQKIQTNIETGKSTQSSYPLFNCQEENLSIIINEIRSHVSEIMWSKGYKKNAISWGEEIIDDIYYKNSSNKRANDLLLNVFSNLIAMYNKTGNRLGVQRCEKLELKLKSYEANNDGWYDNFIARFCKIIYNKGPLGVLEKGLLERIGPSKRLLELEEFEQEDVE